MRKRHKASPWQTKRTLQTQYTRPPWESHSAFPCAILRSPDNKIKPKCLCLAFKGQCIQHGEPLKSQQCPPVSWQSLMALCHKEAAKIQGGHGSKPQNCMTLPTGEPPSLAHYCLCSQVPWARIRHEPGFQRFIGHLLPERYLSHYSIAPEH